MLARLLVLVPALTLAGGYSIASERQGMAS